MLTGLSRNTGRMVANLRGVGRQAQRGQDLLASARQLCGRTFGRDPLRLCLWPV
jgi:hypothetical protein